MSVNGCKDFEKWHDKERAENVVFDLQKELLEYCESDVKLLKEGPYEKVWPNKAIIRPN